LSNQINRPFLVTNVSIYTKIITRLSLCNTYTFVGINYIMTWRTETLCTQGLLTFYVNSTENILRVSWQFKGLEKLGKTEPIWQAMSNVDVNKNAPRSVNRFQSVIIPFF
jgi:hypothetical protein